jgi:putative transposase
MILKSVSARAVFKRFGYMRRKLWAGELWGDGYFVRTVGEGVTAAMVKRYIQKHAEKGLEPAQGELFPRSR